MGPRERFLTASPDRLVTRVLSPVVGFRWGYTIRAGDVAVADLVAASGEDWLLGREVLTNQFPGWQITEAFHRPPSSHSAAPGQSAAPVVIREHWPSRASGLGRTLEGVLPTFLPLEWFRQKFFRARALQHGGRAPTASRRGRLQARADHPSRP